MPSRTAHRRAPHSRARNPVVWSLALGVFVALSGCGTSEPLVGSDPNNADQVEVFTWWTAGTDRVAYKALAGVFLGQNPGLEFIDASVSGSGGGQAREALAARLTADNPPDTFQTVAGESLVEYADAGALQDLTSWFAENELDAAVFRTDLEDMLSVEGRQYGVPSSINRVNVVWVNSGLLDAAGVGSTTAPQTIDAWLADLAEVRASGVAYPLALGEGWTQVGLFETILISDLGPGAYRNLWISARSWESPNVLKAVEHYGALLDFVDPASRARDAEEAVDSVADGRAAYVVMADFASGAFDDAGLEFGDGYTAWPTPGTDGVFDFTADAFVVPVGAVHDRAAKAWLLSVASTEGQRVFNLRRGSIPARIDADPSEFSPYQQSAFASFKVDTLVPSLAHGVAASREWSATITDLVVRFGISRDAEWLAGALTSAADEALKSSSPST